MNGRGRYSVRVEGAKYGASFGTALAIAIANGYETHALSFDYGQRHVCEVEAAQRVAKALGATEHRVAKIDLRLGPALATLDAQIAAGAAGSFDFAFIDADKSGYDAYYERCLVLLRPGVLIAIDNVLWGGSVARPSEDADTTALQALNRKIHGDERVDIAMLPLGDGVTLARKR